MHVYLQLGTFWDMNYQQLLQTDEISKTIFPKSGISAKTLLLKQPELLLEIPTPEVMT